MTLGVSQIVTQFHALNPINQFLVGIALSIIGAKVIEKVGIHIIKQFVQETATDIDDILFEDLHSPLYTTIAFVGIYQSTKFLSLSDSFMFVARGLLLSILIAIWATTLKTTGKRVFKRIHGYASLDKTFIPVFESIWTLVVFVIAIFAFLKSWSINVTPLLASAGVAGVAIGFAAKDAVANFFGGMALYFDGTYKVGDFVVLNDGQAGTVTDIGIRSTTIVTRDDIVITVPNSVLNSTHVINESRPHGKRRITIPVGIAYGSDLETTENVLKRIADDHDSVKENPSPRVRFREFGDSALQYELLCWVSTPEDVPEVRHDLHKSTYKALREEGITIPFPQRNVYLSSTDEGQGDE